MASTHEGEKAARESPARSRTSITTLPAPTTRMSLPNLPSQMLQPTRSVNTHGQSTRTHQLNHILSYLLACLLAEDVPTQNMPDSHDQLHEVSESELEGEKRPREGYEPVSDKRTKLTATAPPFESCRLQRLSEVIGEEQAWRQRGLNDAVSQVPHGQLLHAIFHEVRVRPDGQRERCELMALGTEWEHWAVIPPGEPDDYDDGPDFGPGFTKLKSFTLGPRP